MSLFLKNLHTSGIDHLIYHKFPKNIKLKCDFYLYIHDYANVRKDIASNFYSAINTELNTWNYNLKFQSTDKYQIEIDSVKYGFGSSIYDKYDDKIIAKGINHMCSNEPLYEAHIVDKNLFEMNYDKTKYIGQKLLKSNNSNINEELNIFVLRDLITKDLHFVCYMLQNNTDKHVNRKLSRDNKIYKTDINILGTFKDNLIQYLNQIQFDYGRIELIKDIEKGWCIIDINNSPSAGFIGIMACNELVNIMIKICENR